MEETFVCSMCKDEGYVLVNGLSPKLDAEMMEHDPSLRERTLAVGVATMYRCAFCDAADREDC